MIDRNNEPDDSRIDAHGPLWSVWRQDENGNVFLIKYGLTETDAQMLVRDLESGGHKQTYWIKEDSRNSHFVPLMDSK